MAVGVLTVATDNAAAAPPLTGPPAAVASFLVRRRRMASRHPRVTTRSSPWKLAEVPINANEAMNATAACEK